MPNIKYYSGIIDGEKIIVRAGSKKSAAETVGCSAYHFNRFFSETKNDEHINALRTTPVYVSLVQRTCWVPADGKFKISYQY